MEQRTIKFRAWLKNRKEMRYDITQLRIERGRIYNLWCWGDINILSDEFELMQFTGLLDKNGKEIYEGDIIKAYGGLWIVYWEEKDFRIDDDFFGCGWATKNTKDEQQPLYVWDLTEKWKVIGNIMENPDLLEKENGTEVKNDR